MPQFARRRRRGWLKDHTILPLFREFLTSTRLAEAEDPIARRFHVLMTPSHTLMAQACLGILLHLNEDVTSGSLEDYPLAEYAALHCLIHAQFEGVSANIEDGIKRLFDPSTRHLALALGIRSKNHVMASTRTIRETLHHAAVNGLRDIVRYLVERHGQVVDAPGFSRNETPLSSASRSGHLEVVRVLLQYGADASAQDARKSIPLHRTSERGHLNVARVLIEHGAKAGVQDVDKSTPR